MTNSPDGTGAIAGRDSRVHAIHRPSKLGIGSAHFDGISWAYDHHYSTLVTMDCDFAHSPEYISAFVTEGCDADVVIGTRFVRKDSLSEWNAGRKFITHLGHFLTRFLLGMRYDATGAFRCYALDRLPRSIFSRVPAIDYAFFFQSLHILHLNGRSVAEIPIFLPARVYGSSKMAYGDILRGFWQLLSYACSARFNRHQYLVER
jgi:dolichol-phosphate mannosyltransferase